VMELWEERTFEKDYRAPKKQRDGQQERNHEENVTSDVLQYALILSVDNISESWVVDSGASFHGTPDRKHFLDYVQGDFEQVHLGDYVQGDFEQVHLGMFLVLFLWSLIPFLSDCTQVWTCHDEAFEY
jgi:hypothetical protein